MPDSEPCGRRRVWSVDPSAWRKTISIRDFLGGTCSHPTMTALFSRSASSNGVVFATSGSGVQSSTRSSISCRQRQHSSALRESTLSYILAQSHEIRLGRVLGREKVSYGKKYEKQLDCGSYRIVLVTRLDVAQEDGRAGNLDKLVRSPVHKSYKVILQFLDVHPAMCCCSSDGGADC
jgi:hypothetical protein